MLISSNQALYNVVLHTTPSLCSPSHCAQLKFSFPTVNPRPGNHDTTTGSTMSPLANGKVDESSKMHSKVVIIGPQPAIYLAADLDSVLFKNFMGSGFAVGGQRTATVNGSPTRILGLELMEKFCEQPHHFCTPIITETQKPIYPTVRSDTGAKVRRMRSPRRLTRSSSLTVLARKRLGLKDEEAYLRSGMSACAVCDGAVPIFRNNPL
ncbi:hypothetical protein K435DRAFT_284999 [Dendrothele bispora CBS 962.96]|uniref:Uncharacterized protein n=1 Tax=Dendrothele bispora (strain CBS 962.96) TaxID=1314807 RepID=A0A4S8MKM6_DENBC|nr:hypothetical protein K435DRAFT_284999 [Dendrothele bispora CBS 962.96]